MRAKVSIIEGPLYKEYANTTNITKLMITGYKRSPKSLSITLEIKIVMTAKNVAGFNHGILSNKALLNQSLSPSKNSSNTVII